MEISSSVALFAAIGTQIVTSLGLFWAVTSSFNARINDVENRLSKEITEIKVEQAKQGGEIHRLGDKVDYLNQRIDFVYSLLPIPKLALQNPQE
jgi:hypothetical protein